MPLVDALIFYFPQMYTKAQLTLIGIYATLFCPMTLLIIAYGSHIHVRSTTIYYENKWQFTSLVGRKEGRSGLLSACSGDYISFR